MEHKNLIVIGTGDAAHAIETALSSSPCSSAVLVVADEPLRGLDYRKPPDKPFIIENVNRDCLVLADIKDEARTPLESLMKHHKKYSNKKHRR